MSLFKRACLVGVASLLVGGGLALSTPQITAANGPSKCYAQVVEYKYERAKFKTEYQYQKQTRERSRSKITDPWGPWSAWTWWSPASYQWSTSSVAVLGSGDHDGQIDIISTYDRDYQYVQNGVTRQVADGKESTGWLSAPPAGDGWTQTSQRTVNGDRIPCSPKPEDKTEYTNWVDGGFECGATTVTQTRTKKVTTYALVNYEWVGSSNQTTETQTRPLTDAEITSCKPDDRQPTYTEWTDGTWECGDTTVTQTRTRTDYTWINTGGSTWAQTATETTETQTRPLTDAEITSCKPDDKQPTYTEWTDGTWECGDTTVTQTRTRTDYTWTNTGGSTWVENSTETTETQTRPLTDAEITSCKPDDRDPSYTEWTDTRWDCGAATVTQTRTRTDYTWTNTGGSTWVENSTETTETQTRPLTDAEITSCKPDDKQPTYTEWTDSTWECGDITVTQTRTRTDYTWTSTGGSTWEQTATETTETQTRPLTEAELVKCNPPTREPMVDRHNVGTPECGDTSIQVEVTTTTYSYTYNPQTNGWDEASETAVSHETRDLGEDEQFPCSPTEFVPPTVAPICGPDNDDVTVPADTDDIDYVDSGWADNQRTITATWTYDDSELDSWTFTDDSATCAQETTTTTVPEETTTTTEPTPTTPTIAIAALVPVCHNDAPYIDVSLSGDATFNGRAGTVTFKDADGNVVESHRITFQAGETLRFLYPGASVDAAGFATDWPGWKLEGTTWVPDWSDARLRDGLTVVVHVNPTATGTVAYPAATPACIPTPTGVSVDTPTTAPTTTVPSLEGYSLPETGTDTNMIAAISAALVLLGAGAVFVTRSRKA